jgi:nitroreductase
MNYNNETLSTIRSRFTAREYTGAPIDQDALDAVLLAGAQSPSAYNKQPWQIIAVTNPDLVRRLEAAGIDYMRTQSEMVSTLERIESRGGKLFYNAPAIIIIAVDQSTSAKDIGSAVRDCGIVVENMALAASSLGLGNCICGLAQLPLLGNGGDDFKRELQFKEGYDFGCALLLGESNAENPPHKPNLDKITVIA